MVSASGATVNCSVNLDVHEKMIVDSGLVDQTVVINAYQDARKKVVAENVDRLESKINLHDDIDKSTVSEEETRFSGNIVPIAFVNVACHSVGIEYVSTVTSCKTDNISEDIHETIDASILTSTCMHTANSLAKLVLSEKNVTDSDLVKNLVNLSVGCVEKSVVGNISSYVNVESNVSFHLGIVLSNTGESARVEDVPLIIEVMSNDVWGEGSKSERSSKEIDDTPFSELSRKNKIRILLLQVLKRMLLLQVLKIPPVYKSYIYFVSESDTFISAKDMVEDLIFEVDIFCYTDPIFPNPLPSDVNMHQDILELNVCANNGTIVDAEDVVKFAILSFGPDTRDASSDDDIVFGKLRKQTTDDKKVDLRRASGPSTRAHPKDSQSSVRLLSIILRSSLALVLKMTSMM